MQESECHVTRKGFGLKVEVSGNAHVPFVITDLGGAGSPKVRIGSLQRNIRTYLNEAFEEKWITVVHVCQDGRYGVFTSPRQLLLRLHLIRKSL